MELYTTLSSVFTVLSFVLFIGIVWWAWSSRRRAEFAAAANAPFALPDDSPRVGSHRHAGDEA